MPGCLACPVFVPGLIFALHQRPGGAGPPSQQATGAKHGRQRLHPTQLQCQAPGFVEGVSSGCGGCLLGGVGSGLFRRGWGVSVLVFFWGVHVDRGMRADGVVPVDPLGRRDLQVVDGVPGALVSDQFGFIQRVECLGERVVVGVALGADRGDGVAVGKGRARNRSRCTGRPDPNGE